MSTVTPVQGAASLLLQQAILVPAPHSPAAKAEVETVTAVQPVEPISRHDPVTAQARSRVYEALLQAESTGLPAIKLRLIENVAGALGINQENYGSDSAFRAAIRAAFDELAMNPHAREIIAGLPRNLGLDSASASLKEAAEAARAAAEAQREAYKAKQEAKAEREAEVEQAAKARRATAATDPAPAPKTTEAAAPPKTEPQPAPPASTAVPKAESATPAPAAAPETAAAPAPVASSASAVTT